MSTLIRTFNLIVKNNINKQILINLAHVSTVELDDNKLTINMVQQNKEIFGSWFIFWGGDHRKYSYHYKNNEDAQDTYNSIKKAMQQ